MEEFRKIYLILDRNQRVKSIKMFVLIILGMLFEILGIGIVVPAVSLIINPNLLDQYISDKEIRLFFFELPQYYLIAFGLFFLIILYFIKTAFLIYLVWYKNRFAFKVLAGISEKFFEKYLNKNWLHFLENNSAKLIRNSTTEPAIFVNSMFIPIIELIAEIMVLSGILILLILVEPLVTIVIFSIFCCFGFLYNKFFKNKSLELGNLRQALEFQKLKHLQQGFGALKDIKILNRQNYFFNEFSKPNQDSMEVISRWATIKQLPRLLLEFIAVLCLSSVVFILVLKNSDLNNVIPSLAMFGAASMRLLPSSNRILGALQNIKFGKASVEIIYKELIENPNVYISQKEKALVFKKNISLKNVSFEYVSGKSATLQNITINIPKGGFYGIIGESGSGKSTLIDILLGLLTPKSGTLKVDDKNVNKNIGSWQKKIGYVPQDIYLTDDKLKQNIAFGIPEDQIDINQVLKTIKLSQLDDFVATLEYGIDSLFGEKGIRLSGGQLQRISIARALYSNPDVLILDEATSSLDNETEKSVMDAVKSLKGYKTIIVVAHRLSTIMNCDYLYKLSKGRIEKEGKPIDIFNFN